jgi:predicted enzyme related to lactoylglutathione lyase
MAIKYVHTNIISDDWKRLAQFYQDVFDCQPVPPQRSFSESWLARATGVENARLEGIHLRLPGLGDSGPTLEILQYSSNEAGAISGSNCTGLRHLAFAVDDVAEMRDKVLQHGGNDLGQIVTIEISGVGQITFVYMRDPEGNIIELQKWA